VPTCAAKQLYDELLARSSALHTMTSDENWPPLALQHHATRLVDDVLHRRVTPRSWSACSTPVPSFRPTTCGGEPRWVNSYATWPPAAAGRVRCSRTKKAIGLNRSPWSRSLEFPPAASHAPLRRTPLSPHGSTPAPSSLCLPMSPPDPQRQQLGPLSPFWCSRARHTPPAPVPERCVATHE
jgi:hypothetical protein